MTHKKDFSDYLLEKKVEEELSGEMNNKMKSTGKLIRLGQTDKSKGVQMNK